MASSNTVVIGGPSHANPHISEAWQADMAARYAGTRLARQELGGELLPDTPGALWTIELLEKCRTSPSPLRGEGRGEGPSPPQIPESQALLSNSLPAGERGPSSPAESNTFRRLLIAIDPPSGDGTCGIIACALDGEGRAHVLADHSVAACSPETWARTCADAATLWSRLHPTASVQAVAESNQGGQMIQSVLKIADPALRVNSSPPPRAKRTAPSPSPCSSKPAACCSTAASRRWKPSSAA